MLIDGCGQSHTCAKHSEIVLPGYSPVRLDRNRHGGGVLLYIFSFNVVLRGPFDLELIFVSIKTLYNGNICLGIYIL